MKNKILFFVIAITFTGLILSCTLNNNENGNSPGNNSNSGTPAYPAIIESNFSINTNTGATNFTGYFEDYCDKNLNFTNRKVYSTNGVFQGEAVYLYDSLTNLVYKKEGGETYYYYNGTNLMGYTNYNNGTMTGWLTNSYDNNNRLIYSYYTNWYYSQNQSSQYYAYPNNNTKTCLEYYDSMSQYSTNYSTNSYFQVLDLNGNVIVETNFVWGQSNVIYAEYNLFNKLTNKMSFTRHNGMPFFATNNWEIELYDNDKYLTNDVYESFSGWSIGETSESTNITYFGVDGTKNEWILNINKRTTIFRVYEKRNGSNYYFKNFTTAYYPSGSLFANMTVMQKKLADLVETTYK